MENRRAGNDRSEAVLRWAAVGMALAFFGGVVSCGKEGPDGEVGRVAFGGVALLPAQEPGAPFADGQPPPVRHDEPPQADTGGVRGPVTDESATPDTGQDGVTPRERYDLGISAWQAGEPAAAEEHLRAWISHAPDHVKGRVNLARALIELGRPRDAKEHLTHAVNLDPASAVAKRTLARALAEDGDRAAALAMYEEALRIDPDDRWSLNNMGYLLILRGRHVEAVGPLALAAELDSASALFRANLGVALEGAGYPAAALENFNAAAALDPGHERAAANAVRLRELVGEGGVREVDTSLLAGDFRRELLGTPAREEPGPAKCPW